MKDLRWHGAALFTALPMLGLIIMQIENLYLHGAASGIKVLEPAFFFLPVIVFVGASGFAIAVKCAQASVLRVLLLGAAVGAAWTSVAIIAGYGVFIYKGNAPQLDLARLWSATLTPGAFLFPVAMVKCALLRFHARRSLKRTTSVM